MLSFENLNDKNIMHVNHASLVNRNAVRHEVIDGTAHIVIESKTLPFDIVMNNILYPRKIIEQRYKTLNNTLSPIGHPMTIDGAILPAAHAIAIHRFHAGVFNFNARIENGRVVFDKAIDTTEAMKSDRGKRLLERIDELMNSKNPRLIHTSISALVKCDILSAPKKNKNGHIYDKVVTDMYIDHDAIILDGEGGATPADGVGLAVNERIADVSKFFNFSNFFKSKKKDDVMHDKIVEFLKNNKVDVADMSDDDMLAKYDEIVINNACEKNSEQEKNNDANEMQGKLTVNNSDTTAELLKNIEEFITNSLKPINDKFKALEDKLTAVDANEKDKLIDVILNSKKYDGLTKESLNKLDLQDLQNLTAKCNAAAGLPLSLSNNSAARVTYDMPA